MSALARLTHEEMPISSVLFDLSFLTFVIIIYASMFASSFCRNEDQGFGKATQAGAKEEKDLSHHRGVIQVLLCRSFDFSGHFEPSKGPPWRSTGALFADLEVMVVSLMKILPPDMTLPP